MQTHKRRIRLVLFLYSISTHAHVHQHARRRLNFPARPHIFAIRRRTFDERASPALWSALTGFKAEAGSEAEDAAAR